jgi:hypothetical protein
MVQMLKNVLSVTIPNFRASNTITIVGVAGQEIITRQEGEK